MKIATFNINNINKRLGCLATWLEAAEPDVVCLQELKCEQAKFPAGALRDLGYQGVWKGQRSWNGVAILAHGAAPIVTAESLPGAIPTMRRAGISRRPSGACSSPASICRTATRSQARNSTTSWPGSTA